MANPALIAAAAAQHATQRADQQTLDAFRVAGATAPERALPLRRLTGADAGAVERLRGRGLVRGERGDTLWLDERAVIAARDQPPSRSQRLALVIVTTVLVVVGAVLLAFILTTDR